MSWAGLPWLLLIPPAVALVLLLHARKRRDLPVPGFRIWQRVAPVTGSVPQRRRFPWRDPRLWLQLLAVVAAIVALARPTLGRPAEAAHWLVLIDASLGMTATDVAPSRFEAAQAYLRQRWGGEGEGADRVSLLRVAASPSFAAYGWSPGAALAKRIEGLEPSHGHADWSAAAARAAALTTDRSSLRLLVLSDAAGAGLARAALDEAGLSVPVQLNTFGQALVNVGIEDVAAVPRGARADQWQLSGRVTTQGLAAGDALRVVVAYRPFGGDTFLPWGGAEVVLDAQGGGSFELPLDLPGPGEIAVRGPRGDQLPADDEFVVALRQDPLRVAFVGPVEPALLRALEAVGGVELFVADTVPAEAEAKTFDLVIVTKEVEGVPATSTLWFGAAPPSVVAGAAAGWEGLRISAHRLMRDVDAATVDVALAQPLHLPEGATPLFLAGDQVLAWARTTDRGRQVVVGFHAADSTWPAQLSFPAFVAALLEWSAPRTWSSLPGGCVVGARCAWPREAYQGGWRLLDPDGVLRALPMALHAVDGDPLASAVWDEAVFDVGFRPQTVGRYTLDLGAAAIGLPVAPASVAGAASATPTQEEIPWSSEEGRPSSRELAWLLAWLAAGAALADLILARSAPRPVRASGNRRWALGLAGLAAAAWLLAGLGVPLLLPTAGRLTVVVAGAGSSAPPVDGPASASALVTVAGDADGQEEGGAMDLATAIDLALAWPAGTQELRVLLAQDGLRTLSAAEAVDLAAHAEAVGVPIDLWGDEVTAAAGGAASKVAIEFGLTAVHLPPQPRAGAPFRMRLTVQAEPGLRWQARVEPVDGGLGATAEGVGSATVGIELQAPVDGDEALYRLQLQALDGLAQGIETTVATTVGARPKVLLVASDERQGAALALALETQSIEVQRVTPRAMPPTLEAWAAYDAIALLNVPSSQLFTAYQGMLEAYVRDLGGGLLIFGGPSAFGPGGYFRTPLEELSPLSAQIEEEAPEVAMAFVLDRSGSMNAAVGGSTRMEVAKVATLEALGLLGQESLAAIIVFDVEAQVVLPMRSVQETAAFEAALASVNAAGGTAVYPALLLAHEVIRSTESASRHVVVMTDGLSQTGDFASALQALRDLGVSTSFVGIGDGADRAQLTTLTNLGGGTLHMATDVRALPSILAQEALMLSADPLEEGIFGARWLFGADDPIVEAIGAEAPPALLGYVRTTAKDEATVHLVEQTGGDPLLASWRYGLGRVLAFASEADGPWASAWTGSEAYPRIWSQALRWVAASAVRGAWTLEAAEAGPAGGLDVVLIAPSQAEGAQGHGAMLQLVDEDGGVVALQVLQTIGADRSAARLDLPAGASGRYRLRVGADPERGIDAVVERSIVLPLAPLPRLRADEAGKDWLAQVSGGTTVGGTQQLPQAGVVWRWLQRPAVWMVFGLAVFLVALLVQYGALAAWRRTLGRLG